MADNIAESIVKYSDYKYCWCIQNICGTPFINVAKRINGTVYIFKRYVWTLPVGIYVRNARII